MAKEVQIYVKGIRRKEPDLRKLARALIQLVLEQQKQEQEAANAPEQAAEEEAS